MRVQGSSAETMGSSAPAVEATPTSQVAPARSGAEGERFSVGDRRRFERAIGDARFFGVPLSSALESFLNHYRVHRGAAKARDRVRSFSKTLVRTVAAPLPLHVHRRRWASVLEFAATNEGAILLAVMSSKPHYSTLASSMLSVMHERTAVCGPLSAEQQCLVSAPRYLAKRTVPMTMAVDQMRQLGRIIPQWTRTIETFRAEHRLGHEFTVGCHDALIGAAVRMCAYRRIFERMTPSCVVSDYDRYIGNVPLVAAARSLSIPTVTLQHGAINDTGWGEVPSDLILSWGERSKQRLEAWQRVPASKVRVCGNPIRSDASAQRASRPPRSPRRLGLATNPLPKHERHAYFRAFGEGVGATTGTELLKPHPAEAGPVCEEGALGGRVHIRGGTSAIDDFLDDIDVLVCFASSVAIEALQLGRPAIIFVPQGEVPRLAVDWIESGAVLLASSANELADHLASLDDETFYRARVEQGLAFVASEYAAVGTAAAENIRDTIVELIEQRAA